MPLNEPPSAPSGAITGASDEDLSRAMAVFAWLWAIATLVHQFNIGIWTRSVFNVGLTATAFVVLARPASPRALVGLALFQCLAFFEALPVVVNHWVFMAFVNATILVSAGRLALVRRRWPTLALLHAEAVPVVRIELLVLYGFAVFHKLNADWFRPSVSCGVELYLAFAGFWSLPTSPPAQVASIYGVLAIEALIPVLLLFRRTRLWGVLLGVLFHYVLGVARYHNFSAMLFAGYWLFLPHGAADLVRQTWVESRIGRSAAALRVPLRRLRPLAILAAGLVAAAAVILFVLARLPATADGAIVTAVESRLPAIKDALRLSGWMAWWIYGLALTAMLIAWLPRLRATPFRSAFFAIRSTAGGVMVGLLLLNGASPYLGLKTEHSFAMFSNLRTEDHRSNHLVVSRPIYLASYQTDLIRVIESSDPRLQAIADAGRAMTDFEFRSLVTGFSRERRRGTSLVYVRGDVEHRIVDLAADTTLTPPSWIERKLLWFRDVDLGPEVLCRH